MVVESEYCAETHGWRRTPRLAILYSYVFQILLEGYLAMRRFADCAVELALVFSASQRQSDVLAGGFYCARITDPVSMRTSKDT